MNVAILGCGHVGLAEYVDRTNSTKSESIDAEPTPAESV